jgi:hypothetical protein
MEICLDMPPSPPTTTLRNNKGWGCTFSKNGEAWIERTYYGGCHRSGYHNLPDGGQPTR